MIAFMGIVLLTFSAVYSSVAIDYFASILLAPAILMVFGINIYTWKKGQPDPLTFNKMVKNDLDIFFQKINNFYTQNTKQGIKWQTIDGHFWVEIHIDTSKRIPDQDFFSDEFLEVIEANMDYILSLANVSSRGKNMLIRDLNRMEEQEDEDEAEGGQVEEEDCSRCKSC